MRFREFKILAEAILTNRVFQKGQTPFRSSTIDDPFVKNFIQNFSKITGLSTDDVVHAINYRMNKYEKLKNYSPYLYDVLYKNIGETVVFNLMFDTSLYNIDLSITGRVIENPDIPIHLDFKILFDLIKAISREGSGFFPMRMGGSGSIKQKNSLDPIFVPSNNPKHKQFNKVSTAAMSHAGDLILNIHFMQKLLVFGNMIGLKCDSGKYISQGGTIPDEYGYIETLIYHEILHYTYGDFQLNDRYPKKFSKYHNYATDFRSNYILAKSNLPQLPIGLYSDDLNFDREETNTYKKLLATVITEMKKVPPELLNDIPTLDNAETAEQQSGKKDPANDDDNQGADIPKPGDRVHNTITKKTGIVIAVRPDESIIVVGEKTISKVGNARHTFSRNI